MTSLDDILGPVDAHRDQEIAAARAAAPQEKEPFDLTAFEALFDPGQSSARYLSPERRERSYAYHYYVLMPEVMTLAELAARLWAQNDFC